MGPVAPLDVRVLRGDGTPARGVAVVCSTVDDDPPRTDADGRVRFDPVPVGRAIVVARTHGFLPTVVAADVGSDAGIEIRETTPRTVRVRVTDGTGRPLAAACVGAWSESVPGPDGADIPTRHTGIAQFDGDVELLTVRTGADGCADLSVAPGEVAYDAALGGARASVTTAADQVALVLGAE